MVPSQRRRPHRRIPQGCTQDRRRAGRLAATRRADRVGLQPESRQPVAARRRIGARVRGLRAVLRHAASRPLRSRGVQRAPSRRPQRIAGALSCRRARSRKCLERAGFHDQRPGRYDARDELRNAHAKAGELGCDVNDAFDIGDVDLVIRTSPEPLLSGFLPMQCQYAHLQFLSTPLNDLEVEQVDDLVANYRRLPQLRGK